MKASFLLLSFISTIAYGQLSIDEARKTFYSYKLGSYDYHEPFAGHAGYGAPYILTADGGAAFFGGSGDSTGDYGLVVKLDKNAKEEWKKEVRPQFDEMETQSVVQDKNGNFFVFLLSYDSKRYRGGSERLVCLDKSGKNLWDKTIGTYQLLNSPTISYIRALNDGRIALRGHVVIEKPKEGKDPAYHYWEGWIDSKGVLAQKTGDIIDWSNQEWVKRFEPEDQK